MPTQQRTRHSAPAWTQKQIVQQQRRLELEKRELEERELEERQRAEREWRAHQAQPTPHQQLVQEVESLPTNRRSSYLLQRTGTGSANSSVIGHGFLNGSGSHLDHGTSTGVSAWTGRRFETGSVTGTNTTSAVNGNKNMSQWSLAGNVGAGGRGADVDSGHPGHEDDEEDPPVKRRMARVDIASWLADKSSGSSGATGPISASVERMGGVAQFVTQAKPLVDRRPTDESAGMGSGMVAGTSSAVATPTTAVQSHVRFPPGAYNATVVTTYHGD